MLRDYQQEAIDQLHDWFRENKTGNPCLVMPTGSGKSHVIAAICKKALQSWPKTRVLMLTHIKELIEQNAEKMRQHWPGAPFGIYSAGIGKRDLSEPITFAGIQSVRTRAEMIGHIDLVIIDEAHTVSHKKEGGYRKLLDKLIAINPALRVIGLTASPYRLGHGMITEKPALFDALIEPVTIEELVLKGHLSVLRSKFTQEMFNTEGVHKRGGDYIEQELQAVVNTDEHNSKVVAETIALAGKRKSWIFFCAGVQHAERIRDELRAQGISAECVTGETPKSERAKILAAYKRGEVRALTNCAILTTGFDHPGIDLIAMLRPTMSPGLYLQCAGRGLRVEDGKEDCLFLDFAGVVHQHGAITAIVPPKMKGGGGDAPMKVCDKCSEILHISIMICPACGEKFPPPEKESPHLHNDDVMGIEVQEMEVTNWCWQPHTSRSSGKEMIRCLYYGFLSDHPVIEYLPILHDGYAGQKASRTLKAIASSAGAVDLSRDDLGTLCDKLNNGRKPLKLKYKMDGKFHRVIDRKWEETI